MYFGKRPASRRPPLKPRKFSVQDEERLRKNIDEMLGGRSMSRIQLEHIIVDLAKHYQQHPSSASNVFQDMETIMKGWYPLVTGELARNGTSDHSDALGISSIFYALKMLKKCDALPVSPPEEFLSAAAAAAREVMEKDSFSPRSLATIWEAFATLDIPPPEDFVRLWRDTARKHKGAEAALDAILRELASEEPPQESRKTIPATALPATSDERPLAAAHRAQISVSKPKQVKPVVHVTPPVAVAQGGELETSSQPRKEEPMVKSVVMQPVPEEQPLVAARENVPAAPEALAVSAGGSISEELKFSVRVSAPTPETEAFGELFKQFKQQKMQEKNITSNSAFALLVDVGVSPIKFLETGKRLSGKTELERIIKGMDLSDEEAGALRVKWRLAIASTGRRDLLAGEAPEPDISVPVEPPAAEKGELTRVEEITPERPLEDISTKVRPTGERLAHLEARITGMEGKLQQLVETLETSQETFRQVLHRLSLQEAKLQEMSQKNNLAEALPVSAPSAPPNHKVGDPKWVEALSPPPQSRVLAG